MRDPRIQPHAPPSEYHLIMQVWGEAYTALLADICLPALLSPGNIPALAADRPTIFRLFSTEADMARLRTSPAYAELERHVRVEFTALDLSVGGDKYELMTGIHRNVVREAVEANVALVWLVPDSVWADGSMQTVVRAVAAGKRAVMQAAIKVNRSTALPYFQRRMRGEAAVAMPARELVRVGLDHMHAYYRAWIWQRTGFGRNPANVYWPVGGDGLVVRGFHLHPLMLHLERPVADFVSTFDDDLALLGCPDYDTFFVAEDSDDVFHVDLAEDDWCAGNLRKPGVRSASHLAAWAVQCGNLHHRRFFRHAIRVHAGEVDDRVWARVERRSARVALATRLWIWLWEEGPRPLEWLFGLSRTTLLERAASQGLRMVLWPKAPAWYVRRIGLLRMWGWRRSSVLLRRLHEFAVQHAFSVVFGRGVTWRAHGRRAVGRKRWLRKVVWRHVWRAWKKVRWLRKVVWRHVWRAWKKVRARVTPHWVFDAVGRPLGKAWRRSVQVVVRTLTTDTGMAVRWSRRMLRDCVKDIKHASNDLRGRAWASSRRTARQVERLARRARKRGMQGARRVRVALSRLRRVVMMRG